MPQKMRDLKNVDCLGVLKTNLGNHALTSVNSRMTSLEEYCE